MSYSSDRTFLRKDLTFELNTLLMKRTIVNKYHIINSFHVKRWLKEHCIAVCHCATLYESTDLIIHAAMEITRLIHGDFCGFQTIGTSPNDPPILKDEKCQEINDERSAKQVSFTWIGFRPCNRQKRCQIVSLHFNVLS